HSPGITIPSATIATGQIKEGEITSVRVPAELSYLLRKGDLIEISATLDCSPYIDSKDLSITVGKTRESFESQNFNLFPWNNTFANPWIITSGDAYEGAFSARSGYIGHNSESKLVLTINIPYPDSISFWYKVSSEKNYDFLIFRANGIQVFTASGEKEWTQRYVRLNEGINVLEWIYSKDASVSGGYDCAWLDNIVFRPDCFNAVDIKTIKIISPETGKKLGLETITAEIVNLGTDTLKQVNLAFQVNNNQPVTESFNITLPPGDTTGLSFSTKADLTSNGNYIIKVFGINNPDGYALNDTARAELINTAVINIRHDQENLRIMPNPFSQSFRVKFTHPSRENAFFTITNPTGMKIWESQYEIFPGNNEIVISPGNLAPGYYILMIRGKTELKTARLIKTD
ncbi:MAG: T9SS type A sorting domain-containing protein, partial [Bacteroidales bacterium]|nr:T9SS type A sorting domain-containing protein [Bacteroidales bacterium]